MTRSERMRLLWAEPEFRITRSLAISKSSPKVRPWACSFTKVAEREIVNKFLAGKSVQILARELDCWKTTIYGILRRNGTQWKKRPKTGRTVDAQGYVLIWLPSHPMAGRLGYVMEHRLVMAEHLGRLLNKAETVHHINGNRSDNRLENLQLRHGRHGKGTKLYCNSCGSSDISFIRI